MTPCIFLAIAVAAASVAITWLCFVLRSER